MFGEGAMWDDYENNNEDKATKEEPPERLVVDVDIPLLKIEPMSPSRSDSYESQQVYYVQCLFLFFFSS